MQIKWFGPTWNSAMNRDCEEVPTPVGEACLLCEQPFVARDQGVVMPFLHGPPEAPRSDLRGLHLDCHLRNLGIDPRITEARPSAERDVRRMTGSAPPDLTPCEDAVCRRCLANFDEVVQVTVSDGVISGLCPFCGGGVHARVRAEQPKKQA